jgi:hypothetical protein
MIQRLNTIPQPERGDLVRLWKRGFIALVIGRVERAVPEPVCGSVS